MAKRGRPTKYNEELAEDFCTYLNLGVTAKEICSYFGVSQVQYYHWVKHNPEFGMRVHRAIRNRSIPSVQAAAARLTTKILRQHHEELPGLRKLGN